MDTVAAIREIEASIGFDLPEGATVLGFERSTESDGIMHAKLAMSPEQWRDFLSASPLNEEWFEEEDRYLLGSDDGWWDPETAESLQTQQVQLPNAEALNVGVDSGAPARVTVYLMWHGT